jgi:predicted transposase YbfD/YdcC
MPSKTLAEYFSDIQDPRRTGFAHRHDLVEMLLIATCALFSEVEGYEDMARWARTKEPWLRRFLLLRNGVPSSDTFARLFRLLDPAAFEQAFRAWTGSIMPAFNQVAIDGKSVRGSRDGPNGPLHMVSAFATEAGMVLGQEAVADKSNEITAIPVLLEALALKGCLVSIDAMGCQKSIAQDIRAQGADYVLAVKNNQPGLHQAVEDAFSDVPVSGFEYVSHKHGRIVFQHAQVIENKKQVDAALWPDCACLGRVASLRVEGNKRKEIQMRYYISSKTLTHEQFHSAVRQHWAIENQLHWSLDVIFREDDAKIRKDNGPRNIALLRKIILNVLKNDSTGPEKTMRGRRKIAGWNDDEKMRILGMRPL